MILIDDQKMACEPCIRGHRSSKCSHQYERVMVPVRKPGRPLSSCPHPPAASACSCRRVVTAAIPLRQTCHCSSSSASMPTLSVDSDPAAPVKAENDEESSTASPPPPLQGRSSNYRVQKAASGPKNTSRKQSIDAAALEKMDASQVNIVSVPSPTNGSLPRQMETPSFAYLPLPLPPPLPIPSAPAFPGAMLYSPYAPPPRAPSLDHPGVQHADGGGHASVPVRNGALLPIGSGCGVSIGGSNDMGTHSPTAVQNGAGGSSCCSSKNRGVPSVAPQQQQLHHQLLHQHQQHRPEPNATGACCSSKSNPSGSKNVFPLSTATATATAPALPLHAPPARAPGANGTLMQPFDQQAIPLAQNVYNAYYQHPTIFTYPPSYGSFMQPLQPHQWRQIMENMACNQFAHAAAGPAQVPTPPQQPTNSFPTVQRQAMPYGLRDAAAPSPPLQLGTIHECSCGTNCQCLGCAAHPYNNTTQAYVRSAYNSLLEDTRERAGSMDSGVKADGVLPSGVHPIAASPTQLHHPPAKDTGSPTAPQTPASDTASGNGEDRTYPSNEFFFVTYPFSEGDGCGGEEASCPCGDDCDCLGCTIHGGNAIGMGGGIGSGSAHFGDGSLDPTRPEGADGERARGEGGGSCCS